VLAATNRDLGRYVAEGGFREDLFHRLNVVHIRVPPLRERSEEIPVLVEYFLALYRSKHQSGPRQVTRDSLERMQRYSWPGNVRELQNVIQRIVVLGTESVVDELDEPEPRPSPAPNGTVALSDATHELLADDTLGLKELSRRAVEVVEVHVYGAIREQVRVPVHRLLEDGDLLRLERRVVGPRRRRERTAEGVGGAGRVEE